MKRKIHKSKRSFWAIALTAILVFPFACVAAMTATAERIVYDFETGDLQGWQVTQGAFARPVTDLAKEHNTGKPYTKGGTYFVSTLENAQNRPNDRQTGLIESPTIKLTSPTVGTTRTAVISVNGGLTIIIC